MKKRLFFLIASLVLLSACDNNKTIKSNSLLFTQSIDGANDIPLPDIMNNVPHDFSAHWLTDSILVLPKNNEGYLYSLAKIANKKLTTWTLTKVDFPKELAIKFPHLANFQAFAIDLKTAQVKAWLKEQLVVVAQNSHQQIVKASYVQTGGVLDFLYTANNDDADEVENLGATIGSISVGFKLWAPTAQQVSVLLFNEDMSPAASLAMVEDTNTGVWQVEADKKFKHAFYQYQVNVYHPASKKIETLLTTDPYSLSLSVNSRYSQVVDLNDRITQPKNWLNHAIPRIQNLEDNVFYETHIRDFSSIEQALSDNRFRGKYKAFSEKNSDGIKHLKALKKAGLNNIHLLPTFDISTINEEATQVIDLSDSMLKVCQIVPDVSVCQSDYEVSFNLADPLSEVLKSFKEKGEQAQLLISELRGVDNYNWGYDPYHYTVPEGSYAVNPQGISRLVEFREMIQSIHQLGFRVIMDVVYNHTHQSGLEPNAVLDKIVPHYYHRLNPISGAIEQSTCCDNTATERVMMAKLMTDSLVVWSRDYKIDGFRFDLMAHQPKDVMLKAREAVRKVDSDTYFYGEGWNFGEVANNSQFVQASQLELAGSEIGTYSDRLRDAVRGSGNNTRASQGIGNGLFTQPNELQNEAQSRKAYDLLMDQLRVGLAGNLANFPLINAQGESVLGKDIPYGDQPTGYALDPADTINYVSKHDNQTLWDNSQYRLPFDVSTDDRVRMHLQSLSFTLFAQGIPFLHMGSEFLRSKSFLRDSYDYGDWFNRVDFSKHENFYDVGLPPAEKDAENWPLIKQVLIGHAGRDHVSSEYIRFSSKVFQEMLAIRMSSSLFRLTNARDIIAKVSFLNNHKASSKNERQGLLVMKLDDTVGNEVDNSYQSIIVLFNTSSQTQHFDYAKAQGYQLHPIQRNGVDKKALQASATVEGFSVPALSSVIFVLPE